MFTFYVNIQQQSDFYFGSILVSNGFIFYSKWALTDKYMRSCGILRHLRFNNVKCKLLALCFKFRTMPAIIAYTMLKPVFSFF